MTKTEIRFTATSKTKQRKQVRLIRHSLVSIRVDIVGQEHFLIRAKEIREETQKGWEFALETAVAIWGQSARAAKTVPGLAYPYLTNSEFSDYRDELMSISY